ncbi:capsid protein, partial [Citrobacter sp. NMI7905_11]|nr:capsid protein [Citrobacter telavivensis]
KIDLVLPSDNNSYEYMGMEVSRPAMKGKDEQGYYYYTIEIVAKIVIERNKQ